MRREGSGPDFNTFMYSTASILTIRRALFPLDAQVEIKVLAKIQVFFILMLRHGGFFTYNRH